MSILTWPIIDRLITDECRSSICTSRLSFLQKEIKNLLLCDICVSLITWKIKIPAVCVCPSRRPTNLPIEHELYKYTLCIWISLKESLSGETKVSVKLSWGLLLKQSHIYSPVLFKTFEKSPDIFWKMYNSPSLLVVRSLELGISTLQ